ncbi:phosphotransferase enzyme family protein [Cordyceps javanica]|uniref:Phosphotransferase enzyme family protein n=1 Tax=Cordyceps javanica TaxID=43265 RepID=A0A545VJI8_9HYPO|nr:phosphotransferase enzyme family protein [Cordyceps javanica]TQW01830.1 phosphotransferase enzyme family protein [Cordyceps javanica]
MTFNNELIQSAVYDKRDRFISQLKDREKEILRLASSVCGKGPCTFFTSETLNNYVVHGSYNLSFFIRFSDGEKCVFRIPLRPCLAYNARDKLRSEIVTMQYLSEETTIPLPKILAYRTEDSTDPLSTFVILEFIDGTRLSPHQLEDLPPQTRQNLFTSLADIYVQLRRQEFSTIGKLDGSASKPHVGQKTATIIMNMLQLEGLEAFSIRETFHDKEGILKSATSYTRMLLCIGYNAFLKSPNAVTENLGLQASHNHQLFIYHAEQWMDTKRDEGPFVLVHGDLHLSNLVFDDDGRIAGVLDWEWIGLAYPPSWRLFLRTAFQEFLAIVKTREMDMFGNLRLHSEWSQSVDMAEPLVANALMNWTDVEWFVHRYLNGKRDLSDDEQTVLKKENPSLALLAHIKEHDYHRGDRIFAHTPILIFHEDASQNLKDDVWAGLENDAVGGLPTPAKAMFWNLFGQPSHSPAGGRINTNAFSIDIEDTEHYAVFPEIARLNHDCRPNAAYFFDEATLTHYVHAITDIHPGTELTITYIDPHMQREDRMRTLFDTWGFNCSCSTCSLAAQLSRASDARLDEIEEILEDFDEDEEIMSSTMALTLISLYEQERLYGPLAEAYRFAATAFCAEGDVWNTVKYANLAIEIGMLENGFDSENLESLRRLSDDPEEQPCWSLEKSADIEP